MEVCGVTLVMRALRGLVGVVGLLVDCVEVTDMNEAKLGVNFKLGCGLDMSLQFQGHHICICTPHDRPNQTCTQTQPDPSIQTLLSL